MGRVMLTETAEPFVRPPQVAALIGEEFSQRELVAAFSTKHGLIERAVTRLQMFLISDKPGAGTPAGRRFTHADALAILTYLNFEKAFGPSGRMTLTREVSSLLFGDLLTAEEAKARKAEFEREHQNAKPGAAEKFVYRMHQQRRAELRRDPWSASPLWWSRDANRRFALFGTKNHKIIPMLFDRRIDGGKINLDTLEAMGITHWFNATELFCRADGQLTAIVQERVEAD
jgi:hypothetical protein